MEITIEQVSRVKLLKLYFFSFKTLGGDPREILHLGVEPGLFSHQGKQSELRRKTITATVCDFILRVNDCIQINLVFSMSCLKLCFQNKHNDYKIMLEKLI